MHDWRLLRIVETARSLACDMQDEYSLQMEELATVQEIQADWLKTYKVYRLQDKKFDIDFVLLDKSRDLYLFIVPKIYGLRVGIISTVLPLSVSGAVLPAPAIAMTSFVDQNDADRMVAAYKNRMMNGLSETIAMLRQNPIRVCVSSLLPALFRQSKHGSK